MNSELETLKTIIDQMRRMNEQIGAVQDTLQDAVSVVYERTEELRNQAIESAGWTPDQPVWTPLDD